MENSNGFERFSDVWKKADKDSFSQKTYSENDINKFKMKKSADFSKALNTSIIVDFAFKGLLVLSMLVLIWLYNASFPVVLILVLLIGAFMYILTQEYSIREKFRALDDLSKELGAVLKARIQFYHTHFPTLKWMIALSNALFVWVGSLFYYFAKYGTYKMEDLTDVLVSVGIIGMAFIISYYAMTFQYKYYIHELNECLTELSDEQSTSLMIKRQSRRKMVFILIAILAIIIGALLFGYMLTL